MILARQSTARTVTVGPVLDADGVAVTTAVVGDFQIAKNGGAPAALNGSATLTHRATGHYSLALTASDLDTVGQAEVVINATTNACPVKEISVIEEAVYDALFAASATGYLAPTTAGRTLDVTAGGCAGVDWANVESPTTSLALTGTTIATTQQVDVNTIKTQTLTASAGITFGAYVGGTGAAALEATAQSILTDTGTTLQNDITAILADTNELQTDWADGGRLDLILDARASQASVDTIDGVVDSILLDTAEIGAAGAGLTALPWNAAWDAEVQSEVQDAIEVNNLDHLVKSAVDTDFATTVHLDSVIGHLADAGTTATFDRTTDALEVLGAATAPSAAAIADAVWDESIGDHLTGGSTGAALNAAGSAGDPWTTTLPGAYTGAQAGKILADILTDTAEIGAAGAGLTEAGGTGDHLTAITADTARLTATRAGYIDNLSGGAVALEATAQAILTDTGTTLQAELDGIQADTEDIQSRLPAALVSGKMDSNVSYWLGAAVLAPNTAGLPVTEVAAPSALLAVGVDYGNSLWNVSLSGDVGNVVGSVASVTGNVGGKVLGGGAGVITGTGVNAHVADMAANTLTASALAADAVSEIQSGLSTLDAAGVRTAVGLASANLDTQLGDLPTAAENAAAVLAAGDVDGYTLEEFAKLVLAVLAGEISGAETTTVTIRAADDSKVRVTATVTADGNRTALTLDAAG